MDKPKGNFFLDGAKAVQPLGAAKTNSEMKGLARNCSVCCSAHRVRVFGTLTSGLFYIIIHLKGL
jgi:hypothetical protein